MTDQLGPSSKTCRVINFKSRNLRRTAFSNYRRKPRGRPLAAAQLIWANPPTTTPKTTLRARPEIPTKNLQLLIKNLSMKTSRIGLILGSLPAPLRADVGVGPPLGHPGQITSAIDWFRRNYYSPKIAARILIGLALTCPKLSRPLASSV